MERESSVHYVCIIQNCLNSLADSLVIGEKSELFNKVNKSTSWEAVAQIRTDINPETVLVRKLIENPSFDRQSLRVTLLFIT